jgi:aerobic-type carbon monoxide dehydrogenase small subunit (CoxS/CutS family)
LFSNKKAKMNKPSSKIGEPSLRYPVRIALIVPVRLESAMGEYVLNVNGTRLHVNAPAEETLLSVLRNRLDLTGTKYGCGEGQCGACTVLLDGRAARSCLTPVSVAAAAKITTIEGLEQNGALTPVQQAFVEEGAYQCGYCTSGMIMSATALLRKTNHPSEDQIVEAMDGNICRCGTYPRILAAVKRAAQQSAPAMSAREEVVGVAEGGSR